MDREKESKGLIAFAWMKREDMKHWLHFELSSSIFGPLIMVLVVVAAAVIAAIGISARLHIMWLACMGKRPPGEPSLSRR